MGKAKLSLAWQIVIGPKGLAEGTVELKHRRRGEKQSVSLDSALARVTEKA